MRPFSFVLSLSLTTCLPALLAAQDAAWVQIEARPSLNAAMAQAQEYAQTRENVAGFALRTGWYGIALGPYTPQDAAALMARLKSAGQIPQDSYLVYEGAYGAQFYPVGTGAQLAPVALPDAPADAPVQAAPAPAPQTPDETKREARASENALSRDEKKQLQVALAWAGVYDGAIDGLYGRGTRSAMSAWQRANGHPETGVLTTGQRAQLRRAYDAVLDGMDLGPIAEPRAGIAMEMPLGVVEFARYDAPFVHYAPKGDLGARALLISQAGDATSLAGLYEIMQTLEIVPSDGPRRRRERSFVIEGVSGEIHSHTEASLRDGQIKGFTLVWPAGDDARRDRVLAAMRDSFQRTEGVLPDTAVSPGGTQSADLVSGLAVRKAGLSRSGMYITADGQVLTTAAGIAGCQDITLDGGTPAALAHVDQDLGLAVLRPEAPLAPPMVAGFQAQEPRIQGRVALAGFPYGGVLPAAALTFGRLEDLRGLDGDTRLSRVSLSATPSEVGGPVYDSNGLVIGMLTEAALPGGKQPPQGVSFAVQSGAIIAALHAAQIVLGAPAEASAQTAEAITAQAAKTTVLVRCWD